MAWTDPQSHVFVTGELLSASTMNTFIKDNLNDLHRRTTVNYDFHATEGWTFSPTFADLEWGTGGIGTATVGPIVTVEIGAVGRALLGQWCRQYNETAGEATLMSPAISGASTFPAFDANALTFTSPTVVGDVRHGGTLAYHTLSPGLTTWTWKYRRTNGVGHFFDRMGIITPLGS